MNLVPFSPLAHGELNRRSAEARNECGHVAVVALDHGFDDPWAVERLTELATEARDYHDAAMVRVPKPPKPNEPTGLGAVVEDAAGERWIKVYAFGDDDRTWAVHGCVGSIYDWRAYADIDAVRVLSEGAQS